MQDMEAFHITFSVWIALQLHGKLHTAHLPICSDAAHHDASHNVPMIFSIVIERRKASQAAWSGLAGIALPCPV
jgi:hypothetical protein